MTLPPLATIVDVEARYPGPLSETNVERLPALLDDASAIVRSFTRQQFTQAQTTERIRPVGYRLRLPQRPVLSVDAVAVVDSLQPSGILPLPMGIWVWDGGSEVWLGNGAIVANLPEGLGELLRYNTPLMQVVYTHGYAQSPPDVVAVVCSMILRVLDMPGPVSMQSQSVGPYQYRLSSTAQEGILSLTDSEKRVLQEGYRRGGATVELR